MVIPLVVGFVPIPTVEGEHYTGYKHDSVRGAADAWLKGMNSRSKTWLGVV